MKNTLIFSKKAYNKDKKFAKDVMNTSKNVSSTEEHIVAIQNIYPDYIVEPLYTFEHTGMCIERSRSCPFDSSSDAFCAYKKEEELEAKISKINEALN